MQWIFKKHKVSQMKSNIAYPILFIVLFSAIMASYITVIYPNIE